MNTRVWNFTSRASRARIGGAIVAGAVACVLAVHAPWTRADASMNVDIAKFAFVPKEITVAPGTRVVWTNRDETPHTIASDDKSFTSKGMDTGDKFEHTFAAPGDFRYICGMHPFMTGVVHVRKQ